MSWNPDQYAMFAGPRMQPGLDLISRLPLAEMGGDIADLGGGTGELTDLLADRYPDAAITGVDSSDTMLDKARAQFTQCSWLEADIDDWAPERPHDLIYSNAALHWINDHDRLLPRLVGCLTQGGILAIQMPRNFDAPSHVLMRDVAGQPRFSGRAKPLSEPVADPAFYDMLLSPLVDEVDIWETEYLHRLTGDEPVFEWVKSTGLRPVLQALDGEDRDAYLADYRQRLLDAYPKRDDGITLYPFRRLFILARR